MDSHPEFTPEQIEELLKQLEIEPEEKAEGRFILTENLLAAYTPLVEAVKEPKLNEPIHKALKEIGSRLYMELYALNMFRVLPINF